jgi:hypothetical protein
MKLTKIIIFVVCLSFLPTTSWTDDDCDNFFRDKTVRINCQMLKRVEANQQKIMEDQKKIKKALEFFIRLKIPDFNIDTLVEQGEK